MYFQGVGGAVQYPKDYLKDTYRLVRERGGICIADEVTYVSFLVYSVLYMFHKHTALIKYVLYLQYSILCSCFIHELNYQKLSKHSQSYCVCDFGLDLRFRQDLAVQEVTFGDSKVTM